MTTERELDDEGLALLKSAMLRFDGIANAKPKEWGDDMRDQFEPWARNVSLRKAVQIREYLAKPRARQMTEADVDSLVEMFEHGIFVETAVFRAHLMQFVAKIDALEGK